MDEPVNLAEKRATRDGDCREWTPVDALKTCLREIENGKMNPDILYIAMTERDVEKNEAYYDFIVAGGKKLEIVGLLY
ncbi:hypothetical protein LCGC14_3090650, partial [marine sediment metagenome]